MCGLLLYWFYSSLFLFFLCSASKMNGRICNLLAFVGHYTSSAWSLDFFFWEPVPSKVSHPPFHVAFIRHKPSLFCLMGARFQCIGIREKTCPQDAEIPNAAWFTLGHFNVDEITPEWMVWSCVHEKFQIPKLVGLSHGWVDCPCMGGWKREVERDKERGFTS